MERFQQKWEPVLRFENVTTFLQRFQQKWEPVLRFENVTVET
ncbi:MAG: hypothetical protein AAFN80_04350 [Pseudomonadota bacterium]